MTTTFSRIRTIKLLFCLCAASDVCHGQGLSPRAYVITPIHSNAVTLTYTLQDGGVVFDQIVPTPDSRGTISTSILTCFHTLSFFGRSANLNASIPYTFGDFRGTVSGVKREITRSGLAPAVIRFSVNLKGGPAMTVEEFARWEQKTVIGASLTVTTATGQYDPARLINIGANRWAFKPEIGISRRWGHWIVDGYGAVWFFTANRAYFLNAPGTTGSNIQTQQPMGAVEVHLSYDVKPRLWVSLDGNYWHGGETSLNGVPAPTTVQANSRLGATAAIPIGSHQSLKFSYSGGTYVRFGGDFRELSVAWQYSWLGRPN
jgi:hypothetical protein